MRFVVLLSARAHAANSNTREFAITMMMMMMTMMMMMGVKVPHFYIYKLPIVRLSGCYWYNII